MIISLSRKICVKLTALLTVLAVSSACVPPNQHALDIGGPPLEEGQTITQLRSLQSRQFDTLETDRLIAASTATLQDLGFNIAVTSTDFGVMSGSKDRDAVEQAQIAGQVALVILAAIGGRSHDPVYDESQQINVSLVVNAVNDKNSIVRVIFDRHITNNKGVMWKTELIKDPEIYQQFFAKLSEAVFLEANEI